MPFNVQCTELGTEVINACDKYLHLGVWNRTKYSNIVQYATENINSMKFSFFSTLGSSLRKTNLSVQTLSKIYFNVVCVK